MAISKGAAIAGTLGGGSSILVAGVAIKYATSSGADPLAEIKQEINTWASKNGGCQVRVKFYGENEISKEVNDINQSTKKDSLIKLLEKLNENKTTEPSAKSFCETARPSVNKILLVSQESDGNIWVVKEANKPLQDAKDNVKRWEISKEGCSIKIKLQGETGSTPQAQTVNEISSVNNASDLVSLYESLTSGSTKTQAQEQCKAIVAPNKFIVAIQGTDKNWTFDKG